jgi:predicted kinase
MGGFKPELEHLVKIEKLAQIRNALRKGQNVISDDPNYGKSIEKELRGLARRFGTEFQIHVFDTPIEECIRRDALRLKHIGADAIRKYLKYGSQSE